MDTEPAPKVDVPIDVVLSDGSEWTLYYRLEQSKGIVPVGYAKAVTYVKRDVREGNWLPGKVWRGGAYHSGMVNCAQIVSCSPNTED